MTAAPRPGGRIDSVCGTLYTHKGSLGEACITIRDGTIQGINESPRGEAVLDHRGSQAVIIPGIIDLHVHLRGLELSYKEDEHTGTLEAAAAGITMVVDMPNTRPRLDSPAALAAKLDALAQSSLADYGVYAGIPGDPTVVERLASKPIAGFKVYPQDYGKEAPLRHAARLSRLIVVHPELPEAEAPLEVEKLVARSAHRGCHLEAAAVSFLEPVLDDGRVHVTHVSCHSTLRLAKSIGYSVDVTPHHLAYTLPGLEGCYYRVNPPLRSWSEASRLLQSLLEGGIDALASDHAPHAPWEKSEPLTCSPGFPWLGLWPWLAYRLLRAAGMGPEALALLASHGPARVLGLDRVVGGLEPGMRANLTVFLEGVRWRYPGPRWHKHRWPVHFMEPLEGYPLATIVGGRLAYHWLRGHSPAPLGANLFHYTPRF